jgi:predicted nucleic acid-binding protein
LPPADKRRCASRGSPQCRDPDDQKFLEAALAARADFLVTKDQALLELAQRVPQFRILTPAEFGGL